MSEQLDTGPPPSTLTAADPVPPSNAEAPIEAAPAQETTAPNRRPIALWVWLGTMLAFLMFVAFAGVEGQAGRIGGELRVARAWSLLADQLPDGTPLRVLFWVATALFVGVTGLALWLAVTATPSSGEEPSERSPGVG